MEYTNSIGVGDIRNLKVEGYCDLLQAIFKLS